ncbi:MAG: hypothetical protein ACOX8K_13855 [Lachnospiraceae bacterium]
MTEAVLLSSSGQKFYPEKYTATPAKVRKGKRFKGNGSYNTQEGTLPEIPATEYSLPINGEYVIQPGIHSGQDRIYQDIPTKGNVEVTPTAAGDTIGVAKNYMLQDVVIQPLDNFRPEVIKKGVTVGYGDGAITGKFQGFVD